MELFFLQVRRITSVIITRQKKMHKLQMKLKIKQHVKDMDLFLLVGLIRLLQVVEGAGVVNQQVVI